MTKTSRDIPKHEGMSVADRLKAARQDANLTRRALSEVTGIPSSTVEKYERGDMDPNTTRLKTICNQLGVSVDWVLNGDEAPHIAATPEPAETQASANVAEPFAETFVEAPPQHEKMAAPVNENDKINPMKHVRVLLDLLDDMRGHRFDGLQRQAMALENDIRVALKYLEPDELLALADERGLHQDESCLDTSGILDLFTESLDKGQIYCGNIEERILDTAILGVDLFSIEREPLVKLADKLREDHDIEAPVQVIVFSSWGDHKDFVPLIRPYVRAMSYGVNFIDFAAQDEYSRREE
jgi:transcriptional regulator with XRE-family HTH domain